MNVADLSRLTPEQVEALVATLDVEQRARFVQTVKNAATHLSNAAYLWSGKAPDAKPTPDAYAASSFSLAMTLLDVAAGDLEDAS